MTNRPPLLLPSAKPDAETCLGRIDAWFHQEIIDRPPVRFHHHNIEFERGEKLDANRWGSLEERWFDAEYQVDAFEKAITNRIFHGETFPVFWPNLGPNVYSAFYGGELKFDEVTSWYEPVVGEPDDLSGLNEDYRSNRYFLKIEEITRMALDKCGGRYWVGYSDLHPALDCVAGWLGTTALLEEMSCEPERLRPLLDLSVRDFREIYGHFDTILKSAGHPSVTWMGVPVFPGAMHIPSCDVSSMISAAHFKQFSLPLLRKELPGMDRNIYHVDGPGVARHLDVLLGIPEIHAIQWVQGVGVDRPILQWIPLIQKVQAAGKSIIVDLALDELAEFCDRVRPQGVFLCMDAEGEESRVLEFLSRWAKEARS